MARSAAELHLAQPCSGVAVPLSLGQGDRCNQGLPLSTVLEPSDCGVGGLDHAIGRAGAQGTEHAADCHSAGVSMVFVGHRVGCGLPFGSTEAVTMDVKGQGTHV